MDPVDPRPDGGLAALQSVTLLGTPSRPLRWGVLFCPRKSSTAPPHRGDFSFPGAAANGAKLADMKPLKHHRRSTVLDREALTATHNSGVDEAESAARPTRLLWHDVLQML